MFLRRFHLFTLFGFKVGLDLSWFLIAVLIVWSLAKGYFPGVAVGLDEASYWWMGVAGALGLFASVIFHELAHSLVARRFGLAIKGITLFIFGGVAEMEDEPPSPKAEFLVAIAGPISSYVLAGLFFGLMVMLPPALFGGPLGAVLGYLALINVVLATFNLLPAVPLDGGRVLRASIWWWTGDLMRATRIGAFTGRMLGGLLMAFGVLNIVTGSFVPGMWQGLIGFFIINAAAMSESQMVLKLGLADVLVRDLMTPAPITVPAELSVQELVEQYFYRHYHKAFPVLRGDELIGCVRLEDIGKVAKPEWAAAKVADIMEPDSAMRAVSPEAPVLDAMKIMQKQNSGRIMVAAGRHLEGMLTMRDVMNFLAVRLQLEPGATATAIDQRHKAPQKAAEIDGGRKALQEVRHAGM